jgi:hypothetical protein
MRLFIFAALIPFTAWGQPRDQFKQAKCQGIPSETFSRAFLQKGVDCKALAQVQKVASAIHAFAPFQSPITLFLNREDYDSYTNIGRLTVLNHHQMSWGQVKPEEKTELIWAHELGHTLFNDLLIESFTPILPFRDYMAESAKLITAAKNPELNTAGTLKDKWKTELADVRDLQVPYNELFADLVAVLFAEDALAMQNAMLAPGMPKKKKTEMRYFAFKGDYDLSTWAESEEHYFFAPARAYIGKRFLLWPLTAKAKQEVLRKVFEACLSEIKKHWEERKALPKPSEANKRLIEALGKL